MDQQHAELDLNDVDDDFRDAVEFILDLFSRDDMRDALLLGFNGNMIDLAATINERILRLGLSGFGDYACMKAASILAKSMGVRIRSA